MTYAKFAGFVFLTRVR